MRPLPITPIAGLPACIPGLAVVRGSAVPVVDAALLLRGEGSRPGRFVTVKVDGRRIALAVDAVIGIRAVSSDALDALPGLFDGSSLDAASAIGTLDSELMLVLRSARLVPEEAWAVIAADGAA